ncbi:MAG: hypothetical protein HYZ71_08210 [Deltaproteobacteria bacterium]|nr:hypothetical protein [Deltaproteobacteria bacterium]
MNPRLILFLLASISASADWRGPSLRPSPKPSTQKISASQKLISIVTQPTTQLNSESPIETPTPSMGPTGKPLALPQNKDTKTTTYFDENAAKGEKRVPPVIDSAEATKRSEHRNPPGQAGSGPMGIPQRFDRMWPICIFIDPSVPNGNQIVKEMSDMAAHCQVNLVSFPFYIKPNYPKDPDSLNKAAKHSCNAIQGMNGLGIARASVVTLVNNPSIPRRMCNSEGMQESNSCGEVGYKVNPGQKARMQATGTWGGEAQPGESAAAIIGPGGFNAATVAGRAQGQAQMAMPWGYGAGNGTGGFSEGYAGAGSDPEKGWSAEGCNQMKKSAFPNTGNFKWLPTQKNYVALGKTLWDITGNKTVFNTPQPGGGGIANSAGTNAGTGSGSAAGKAAFTPGFMDGGYNMPAIPPPTTPSVLPEAIVANDGHKQPSSTSSSSPPAAAADFKIQPKVKIGGQLSLDNNFLAESQQPKSQPGQEKSLSSVSSLPSGTEEPGGQKLEPIS